MSDQPPRHPIFDRVYDPDREKRNPDSIATDFDRERMPELEARLNGLLSAEQQKPRRDRFLPFLVVRSILGDNGTRALPAGSVFWESPDIWLFVGDPASAPDIPPGGPGGVAVAGVPNTLYAHVWNLGLAPIMGVRVEFHWLNPSLGLVPALIHHIGTTLVDLPPRTSFECHRLVKCPVPWIPDFVNNGHECLFVRVSSLGDPIGINEWNANLNRHVAQRNISVLKGPEMDGFLRALENSRPQEARVQLVQVGGPEAELAIQLVHPQAVADPRIRTHVLAELRPDGRLVVPRPPAGLRRIIPGRLLDWLGRERRSRTVEGEMIGDEMTVVPSGATLADLIHHHELLPPEVRKTLEPAGEATAESAQVLRVEALIGTELVGGYTIVLVG